MTFSIHIGKHNMSKPGKLGLGLHSGPSSRTIYIKPRDDTASPVVQKSVTKPTMQTRGKTDPMDATARPKDAKPQKKLVMVVKIKSPALKKALYKRNLIKTK